MRHSLTCFMDMEFWTTRKNSLFHKLYFFFFFQEEEALVPGTMKVYLWDSFTDSVPLCETKTSLLAGLCSFQTLLSKFQSVYTERIKWREGNGNPLQCSCLENSKDRGAWWAIAHGVAKGQTWLGDFHFYMERLHSYLCIILFSVFTNFKISFMCSQIYIHV